MGELVRRLDYERRSRHLLKKGDARLRFTKEYSPQVQAANELAKKMRQRRMKNIQADMKMFGFKHNDEMDNLEKFRKALSVKSLKYNREDFERSKSKSERETPHQPQQQKQKVQTIIQAMPQNCVLDFGPGNRPIYTSSGQRSRAGTPKVSPACVDFRPRSSRRPQNWSPPRTSDIWRRPSSRYSTSTSNRNSRPQSFTKNDETVARPQSLLTGVFSRPTSYYSDNVISRPGSHILTSAYKSRPSSYNEKNVTQGKQRPKTGIKRNLLNHDNRPITAHSQRTFQSFTVTDSDCEEYSDVDDEFNYDRYSFTNPENQLKSFRSLKREYTLKEDEILDKKQELLKLLKRREISRQQIIDEKIQLFGKKMHLPKLKDRSPEKDKYRLRAAIPRMPPLV